MTFYYKLRQTPNVDSLNVTTSPTQPFQAVNKNFLDQTLTNYVKTDLTNFNKPNTTAFSDNAPANPKNGDLWLNTTNGCLYVYYQDGDSNQWIQPAQNILSFRAASIESGSPGSLSFYSQAGTILASSGANLTWNPFTNTLGVTGTISATTVNATFNGNLTGNVTGNVSGNAGTVTNGVYTTGSYSNPSWITSLAGSKVSNAVLTTGSYANPSWITSIDGSKITGNIFGNASSVTNGVYTTGSYADPSWITSLSPLKVGLNNVTNESKATMFFNPVFTGTVVAPTPAIGTNNTTVATTAFVNTAITNLIGAAPAALDTLNELSAALNNDANFSTTITNLINNGLATKAPLVSPAFSGTSSFTGTVTFTGSSITGLTASMVGLGNVTNESKTTMFTSPTFTGTTTTNILAAAVEYTLVRTGDTNISGVYAMNCSLFNSWSLSVTGATSLAFTNVPAAGNRFIAFVIITNGNGSGSISAFPSGTVWPSGVAPTLTTTSAKTDIFSFMTVNGGSSWFGTVIGQNY